MSPGDNLWNKQSLTFSAWICEIGNKENLSKKTEVKISSLSIWECVNTYISFHNRPFLNVDDNISRRSSHHGHCKHTRNKPQLIYVSQCTCQHNSRMCVHTSCRHAHITVNAMRVAAELLKVVDGALTHHWFPTEWSVVNYLQHNGRGVHLLFGQKLVEI